MQKTLIRPVHARHVSHGPLLVSSVGAAVMTVLIVTRRSSNVSVGASGRRVVLYDG